MNVGLATGETSGVLVIDIDREDLLFPFLQEFNLTLDSTLIQKTGRGYHFFFQYPQNGKLRFKKAIKEGIDIRTDNMYVVITPSVHISGTQYHFINESPISPLPERLLEVICRPQCRFADPNLEDDPLDQFPPFLRESIRGYTEKVRKILESYWQDGFRHNLALGLAGLLRQAEVPREKAEAIFLAVVSRLPNNHFADRQTVFETTYNQDPKNIAGPSFLSDHGVTKREIKEIREIINRLKALLEGASNRVVLPYTASNPSAAARLLEEQVIKKGLPFYRVGGKVMLLTQITEGHYQFERPTFDAALALVDPHFVFLREETDRLCSCPDDVLKIFLESRSLPEVEALVATPIIDREGNIITGKGYNEKLKVFFTCDLSDLKLPDKPNKEDALEALSKLSQFLKPFPFATKQDHDVAISALMTSILRPSMELAPMYVITSPSPGSGKTLFVDLMAILALGRGVSHIGSKDSIDEIEKRLEAKILAGETVISVDNFNSLIRSNLLCTKVLNPIISVRPLMTSKHYEVKNRFLFFLNGNNIEIAEDLTRRAILIRLLLPSNIKDPDFSRGGFVDRRVEAKECRKQLIEAVFTIVRAYIAEGRPCEEKVGVVTSFPDWSKLVREPLIWLGLSDPWESSSILREEDPIKLRNFRILQLLDALFQTSFSAKDVVDVLEGNKSVSQTLYEAKTELRRILREATKANGELDSFKLGHFFRKLLDQPYQGLRLIKDRIRDGYTYYAIVESGEVEVEG